MKALPRKITDKGFRPDGRNWPLIVSFMIDCGGSTKSSTGTALAVEAARRGYRGLYLDLDANRSGSRVLGYDDTALEGRPTVADLVVGKATLDEVAVPARVRIGPGYKENAFETIPNLRLLPASRDLSGADTTIAVGSYGDWFVNLMHNYEGDDEVLWADFPAKYGKLPYSVARMMDESDALIPSVRADPKDLKLVPDLFTELEDIRAKNAGNRFVPGRPTVSHMVLTSTPTASYTEALPQRAIDLAENLYGHLLLPYVRYSAEAKKIYESDCPIEYLAPHSYPAEDYRKIVTALGFERRPAA
ncbi:ParA family protein [Kitasatospora kifunensis]|uniref:Cellulose biosynthesis protein BcsQ n=1 Tax=Kitasatospora kifunensis TaxID=58351 RepID=A0A7W7RBY0_KITKI|nr:ParA family protein [Kitasatospora kifunensis]MBB4929167.1 cellulose biosynthesis protein BcsQ [Kitasatospora kifunensis]